MDEKYSTDDVAMPSISYFSLNFVPFPNLWKSLSCMVKIIRMARGVGIERGNVNISGGMSMAICHWQSPTWGHKASEFWERCPNRGHKALKIKREARNVDREQEKSGYGSKEGFGKCLPDIFLIFQLEIVQ